MKFCDRLKDLRIKSPLTQKELATKLDISISAYQYYETGRNEPSIDKLIILADIFNVSIDYLVGRID